MQGHDSIPLRSLITAALWALVFAFLAAGWICMLAGQPNVAVMLALTACASSAVSATWTIRTFAQRTQDLIRFANDIGPPPEPTTQPPDLRPVASPQRTREPFTS